MYMRTQWTGHRDRRQDKTRREEMTPEEELEELKELESLTMEDCQLLLWYDEALNLPDVE
jgi:hypothetical protein